ncbi:MAG: DUF2341 domain-containing protein [Candidatus Hodarchaeota archaeon]
MGIILISLLGISFIGLLLANGSINIGNKDALTGSDFPVINTSAANTSRNISINPATPENDYTIRLDLNSSFEYGSCLTGGDDIRFYDLSNNSLSYWIEDWNDGGDSTIWIKIPQSGTTSIRMEYGDSGASAVSSGEDTFLFFDDFSGASLNTSKWEVATGLHGNQSISGGILYVLADPSPSSYLKTSFGFGSIYVLDGIAYGCHWLDNARFGGSNQVETINNDYYTSTGSNKTNFTFNYYERWFTSEVQFVNSSLVNFYDDDAFITGLTTNIPDSTMPVILNARALENPSYDPYGCLINSTDHTLGQPGRAFRARTWSHYRQSSASGTDDTELRVDWVFVRKTSENEPLATIIIIPENITLIPTSEDIYISPATPEENYTVRLDLDGTFNYSNCLFNGEDIRFYDGNNDSLSYWIEEWNDGGDSTIWIKIPLSGTTSIRMEYGDSGASAASNGEDTFLFFDDFSGSSLNLSKWEVVTGLHGSQSISSGILYMLSDPSPSMQLKNSFGFSNEYVLDGVPFGGKMEDAARFGGTNQVMTTNNDYYGGPINATTLPYDYYERWFTAEVQFVNASLVKFYDDDAFITEFTTNIPDSTMPVHLHARAMEYPSGDPYGCLINSTDHTLGQPGRAFRARTWNHYRPVSVSGTDDAELRVDWVFVRKTTEHEPIASFDPGINNTIILYPGFGVYDQFKLSHNIAFYLYMLDFGTLTFDAPDIPSEKIVVEGINGMIKPMFQYTFDILIEDGNDINFSSARIFYDDSDIPDGVKENQLLILKKNEGTGAWEAVPSIIINKGGNYIDFGIEADALYMIAGRTANNDITIIIIIIISGGCAAGILAGVSYNRTKKKSKITVPRKKKGPRSYENVDDKSLNIEAYRKRTRLMNASVMQEPVDPEPEGATLVKKKVSEPREEIIDFNKRVDNARAMESEVTVDKITPRCLVHKGEITGLSYTCKHCGAIYCIKCAKHLIKVGESCWTCKNPIPEQLSDDEVVEKNVTVLDEEVQEKIKQLMAFGVIQEEFLDEFLGQLKEVPPQERLRHLEALPNYREDQYKDFEEDE